MIMEKGGDLGDVKWGELMDGRRNFGTESDLEKKTK